MVECTRCGFKVPQAESTSVQPPECPTCGNSMAPRNRISKSGSNLIRNYFKDLWQIMTQPALFFRHMPIHGGMSRALGFALVTHWLGAAIGFLWSGVFGGTLSQLFRQIFSAALSSSDFDQPLHNPFSEWFFGAGQIVADPFLTLFKIGISSFFIFIGARILVSPQREGHPEEINFESAVKIVCFAMTPSILSVIPLFGGALSALGILIVSVIGAKEVYRVSTGRAILIALFPKLLFVGIIGVGLLFFTVAIIQLIALAF